MANIFLDKTGLSYVIGKLIEKFVAKEEGKGLSTNDYTTEDKTKLSNIEATAQVNKIENVKVNGVAQQINEKAVDITVPTGALASKDQVSETDLDSALAEKVNAASEGNHSHANKDVLDSITSAKVAAWDAAEPNVLEAITSDTLTVGEITDKSVAINLTWGTF